jgi:hypothetical protein
MTTTRRTFVEPRTATPDEAGWRFVAPADAEPEPARPTSRRHPSLSWRLRH